MKVKTEPSLPARIIAANLRMAGIKQKTSFLQQYMKELSEKRPVRPPKILEKRIDISCEMFMGRNVWSLSAKESLCCQRILYLHGGAYVVNFTLPHWLYMAALAEHLHAVVIAPDYPLAPEQHANDVFAMMLPLYEKIIRECGKENLTIMGDSAGGGMSLALAQQLRDRALPQPAHIMLLSPWLDITMSNPKITQVDKDDPILNIKGLIESGKQYAGEIDRRDPRVSPIYGSLKGLAPITLFIGTADILLPDCRKLKVKAQFEEHPIAYYEYEGMLHDGMLYPIPEARDIRDKIVDILRCAQV
ncbi:MAG: alpha/beta hydrolase [Candidatus Marinimicrobia bacterium]|nr:alpha/beta hydrolase [Candidatus Neomarinimicrobiota bacterium]